MESFDISSLPASSQDAHPTDIEIERFVQEMVSFVEARKHDVGEQAAIDAFLDDWRGGLAAASERPGNNEAQPSDRHASATVIPFPAQRS